jgi:hypothetical protein
MAFPNLILLPFDIRDRVKALAHAESRDQWEILNSLWAVMREALNQGLKGYSKKDLHLSFESPFPEGRLDPSAQTFERLLRYHGSVAGVIQWLNTPLTQLKNCTPLEMIVSGGADSVLPVVPSAKS